ncbi:hypothetical protein [Trinickia mobilis]|uniref:hypothetical protein n=1 Tax=Trinickia mobilis TaxID=2816356 RepID=UPI001A8FB581|nr:hypothetical protein [Trinickia mobilis]
MFVKSFVMSFMGAGRAQRPQAAALRAAYVGSPLTPTGYVVLALTVGAIAMVAMLATSSTGNELEGALRLNAYFA